MWARLFHQDRGIRDYWHWDQEKIYVPKWNKWALNTDIIIITALIIIPFKSQNPPSHSSRPVAGTPKIGNGYLKKRLKTRFVNQNEGGKL